MALFLVLLGVFILPFRIVGGFVVVKNGLLALELICCHGLRVINKYRRRMTADATPGEASALAALETAMQAYCMARFGERP